MAGEVIVLNKEQIDREEYKNYDPVRNSFNWNKDHTEVRITPLLWHDDASYVRYQGDPEAAHE